MTYCYENDEEYPHCHWDYKCNDKNTRDEGKCKLKCSRCKYGKPITVAEKITALDEILDLLFWELDNTCYADILDSISEDLLYFAKKGAKK
jgi:hypothetical protein